MTRANLTDPAPPAFDPAAVLTAEDVRNRHGQEDARIRHLNRVRDGSQPPACAWCRERANAETVKDRFVHNGIPLSNRHRTKFKQSPFWFCSKCVGRLRLRAEWAGRVWWQPPIMFSGSVWPDFEPPVAALDIPFGDDPRKLRVEIFGEPPSQAEIDRCPFEPRFVSDREIYPPEPWERRLWAAFDRVRKENAPCPSAPEVQKETEAPSSEGR